MTCQCGQPKVPNGPRPDITECLHCDRRCVVASCAPCANLGLAGGTGPMTDGNR